MKFSTATKPLIDAVNLGIINANISKYYQKSIIAELTCSANSLRINLEASGIVSEITLKGQADESTEVSTFVDCTVFKQLISSLTAPVTELEFLSENLVIHSGKSKFNLSIQDFAKLGVSLDRPALPDYTAKKYEIKKEDWKFIQDHQRYALSMAFTDQPVYTRFWAGGHGDVLTGDFELGMFTHSAKSPMPSDCLLKDTIVNLFNSLPEGATFTTDGNTYTINVQTDSYTYTAQFTPESEDELGSYNADMIISVLAHKDDKAVSIPTATLNKYISQAELLKSSGGKDKNIIKIIVFGNTFTLKDENVDCKIELKEEAPMDYEVSLGLDELCSMLKSFDTEYIKVAPSEIEEDGQTFVTGLLVYNDDLAAALAYSE